MSVCLGLVGDFIGFLEGAPEEDEETYHSQTRAPDGQG